MQDIINNSAVQVVVQRSAMKRVQRIAASEYREIEGQLHAMCDLWERTYGVKQMQIKKEIAEPPKLKVVNSTVKTKRKPVKRKSKPLSEAHKAKLREINLGKKMTDEQRRKLSMALRGRKQSPESVQKRIHSRKINAAKKKLAELQAYIAAQKNPEINSGK